MYGGISARKITRWVSNGCFTRKLNCLQRKKALLATKADEEIEDLNGEQEDLEKWLEDQVNKFQKEQRCVLVAN